MKGSSASFAGGQGGEYFLYGEKVSFSQVVQALVGQRAMEAALAVEPEGISKHFGDEAYEYIKTVVEAFVLYSRENKYFTETELIRHLERWGVILPPDSDELYEELERILEDILHERNAELREEGLELETLVREETDSGEFRFAFGVITRSDAKHAAKEDVEEPEIVQDAHEVITPVEANVVTMPEPVASIGEQRLERIVLPVETKAMNKPLTPRAPQPPRRKAEPSPPHTEQSIPSELRWEEIRGIFEDVRTNYPNVFTGERVKANRINALLCERLRLPDVKATEMLSELVSRGLLHTAPTEGSRWYSLNPIQQQGIPAAKTITSLRPAESREQRRPPVNQALVMREMILTVLRASGQMSSGMPYAELREQMIDRYGVDELEYRRIVGILEESELLRTYLGNRNGDSAKNHEVKMVRFNTPEVQGEVVELHTRGQLDPYVRSLLEIAKGQEQQRANG